jgi:D-tyrosyl-tRNA(Tyr) deacylase
VRGIVRAVVQRVSQAKVEIDGEVVGSIGRGFAVFLGVAKDDTESDAQWMAAKIAGLRVFEDEEGKMNLSLGEMGGSILAVSNFTLLADCRKGRRPSFDDAAAPQEAQRLYEAFAKMLAEAGVRVETGRFQEKMLVSLSNDGPGTLLLDSRKG